MNNETDDSESDGTSTEGEYTVAGFEHPKFDFTSWNPEPPAGLQFMCLVPLNPSYTNSQQRKVTGKIRVSQTHRRKRMKEQQTGRTTGRNIHDEKKLRNAASKNEYCTVIELLDSGVDPCSHDEKKRTALHFASCQGHELIVKVLLDKGADVNQKDILGNTPLHLAACTCQVPVVSLLLKAGPDLELVNKYGTTPVTLAKAKLKYLAENKTYSSKQIRDEVVHVSEMMKTYLDLSGLKSESEQVDELCQQLQRTSTREQVDNISSLLADFTSMTLQKKNDQHPG
ncbi:ankyrin repeat domain-containing protein 54-like [Haliotis rubra]|uniref:ankyrin repeat domain-containing protein 54-like n=1 Tax=Haliotis rubra TaxID=36100 RepID=UPI001EE56950|nr:ankyrin repeat domain-containing protein 54-like [Haliotis rubra]